MRRVRCASTRFSSILIRCSIPPLTPELVISVNCTRESFASGTSEAIWAAIASPSRSGSVARIISDESFAFVLNILKKSFLSSSTTNSIVKSLSTSTPNEPRGKSFTWPTQARTSNSSPRYFDMVFALEGDSTMMIDF